MGVVSSNSLLLVDADTALRELLRDALSLDGRSIHAVEDGSEALRHLRRTEFDVILAGQGTNGLDQFQLLRKARAIRPAAKVIVAGETDPAAALRAVRERAFSYVHKPLASQAVAEIVQQALNADSWQNDLRLVSARPDWITLDIRCKLGAADRATQFLRELESDLPPQACEDVTAAFRELLLNGIEHGAKNDPRKRVRASFLRTGHSVIVHLHDPGKGFSLDLLPHAAISNPADSPVAHVEFREEHGQRPGGFGILMTRNMVDELLYNERGNAVLFVKYLK
jgi:CheY-like chemotaxis protein/anti-sigma regulatory factor (Ser/Thr protein kinase)